MSKQRTTAAERKEAERVEANRAYLAGLTDEKLATVETDYYIESDPIAAEQIAAERAKRGGK